MTNEKESIMFLFPGSVEAIEAGNENCPIHGGKNDNTKRTKI